ncbi:MAG: D-alanine--D-alanine ligase [Bacteroidota bacterium]
MKKNIAIVTGGYSGEAIISMQSADMVMKHLDADKYNSYKVVITKDKWICIYDGNEYPIDKNNFSCLLGNKKLFFDSVFMALHGTPGEDGKLQGYFDMLNIPYTSCGVVVSALTFNKALTIAVLSHYGIHTAKSIVVNKKNKISADEILTKISLPCFVKPNESGSSIGTSKVKHKEDLISAIEKSFKEGDDTIIEEFIEGTEITCGVIRYKEKVKALTVSEIVSKGDFFDFHAKYKDNATEEITPARISSSAEKECKNISEFIYSTLGCKGMIRIDYILKKDKLFLLEVNSIPGLTERSLLPKQAVYCGISLKELFNDVIVDF